MRKPRVLFVQGTHSYGRSAELQWWQSGRQGCEPCERCESPFARFLRAEGFEIIGAPAQESYFWDTDLDGVGFGKRARTHASWIDAGDKLELYVDHLLHLGIIDPIDVNIIAHSHGLQAVAYAASKFNLQINNLLTLGSPVREDMREHYARLAANVASWRHVYSDAGDRLQWLGAIFDGRWGIVRKIEIPGVLNVRVPRVAHSKLLNESRELLKTNGDLDFLRGVTYAPTTDAA